MVDFKFVENFYVFIMITHNCLFQSLIHINHQLLYLDQNNFSDILFLFPFGPRYNQNIVYNVFS